MMLCSRMKIRLLAGVTALLLINTAAIAQKHYNKLVWADEFNQEGLPDSTKWGYDTAMGCPALCGWGNNELEYYTVKRTENARVENGLLTIEARKEQYENAGYTSARLVAKTGSGWKYGRFEIKAKIPAGRGIWPAIWMLPDTALRGGWPHSGEIDIMENVGYWPDTVFSTVHTGKYNGMLGTQRSKGFSGKNFSTAFHVYGIEWDEKGIVFFIDHKKFFTFKNDGSGTEAWPFNTTFHLLLNVAVGGNWGGKYGVDDTIFPQKMVVDYVRVYQ